MTRSYALLPVFLLLLSGCTLTPSHFNGEDLLDTGHKTEMQDPVAVPVKEASDRPRIKTSVKKPVEETAPTPLFSQPEIKKEPPPVALPLKKPVGTEKSKEKPTPVPTCGSDKKSKALPPPAPGKKAEKPDNKKRETLKGGDRLKITVFREKDLSGDYKIDSRGIINFPLVGPVPSAGLTPRRLQDNLAAALAKGYLIKPQVNVEWLDDCKTK